MNVLGIYGSPRRKGNSDLLLDRALAGAESGGADIETLAVRDFSFEGCRECGGCDKTGNCVVKDDMQDLYERLIRPEVIIVSSPCFFYNVPSALKALIDRCQALWSRRMLSKTKEERKNYDSGRGYLISVGATRGKNLFDGMELTMKYFYDALDMSYEGGLLIREIEGRAAIEEHSDYMDQAFELGKNL